MRVYRLMKNNANSPSTEVFKTYDCSDFDLYITKQIYAGNISYDPACCYPSKEKQVNMFCEDLWKGYEHFDGIDHEHWIDIQDLDPTKNRDDYIMSVLHEHHKEAKELGYEVMVTILQGSQNYGLDIYNDSYKSDIDSKAIVIPTFEDFVVGRSPVSHTHERENKEHIDLKDIRIMFDTFKRQNVNFVEILFSDYFIVEPKYKDLWEDLRSLAEELVHAHPSQTVKTMSGISKEKYKALKHPYPTIKWKIDKWGYDGKQLHHIIRINDFIKRYIYGLSFKEAMQPTDHIRDMLIKAKLNEYTLEEAEDLAKKFDEETNQIKDDYIKYHGENITNEAAYDALNSIKVKILKKYFTEQLLND